MSASIPPTIKALTKVNPSASNEFFILLMPLPRKYPKIVITTAGMMRRRKSCPYVSMLAEVPGNPAKVREPRKEKNMSIKRAIKMLIRNLTMKCSFGGINPVQFQWVLQISYSLTLENVFATK
jgi:hypothetical protein